jgi:hypothetical protein
VTRRGQGKRPKARAACAVVVAILLVGGHARANGRYPASSLIVFDPVDRSHLVVSTTFGLLESRDGGKSFLWRCEPAIGVADQQDLMVAITASGATVTTRAEGIATSSDGCSFAQPPELSGKLIGDLALYRSQPHSLAALSTSRLDGALESQVVRSDDDGRTWTPLGTPLPADLFPLTVDAAPSDVARLYLSGSLGGQSQFSSVLLRSNDGGATFVSADIPDTAQRHLAYIAAVHPFDADRVYVRVFNPNGTALLVTRDGGVTFHKILTGADQLFGFALSPDGTQMAFGGPGDGIWVGAADGTNVTRRSDVRPTCLGWTADGLFACADATVDGFSIGRSRDEAATFEPLFRFDALCGNTGCSPDSSSAMTCATAWGVVGPTLGSVCGLDAGPPDAGGPPDAHGDVDAPADAPVGNVLDLTAGGGSGCAMAASAPGGGAVVLLVLSGFLLRRRRGPSPRRSKLV